MKILNLYAGIGGNRKLWGNDHDITAVEWDKEIAAIYQDFFPNDTMIVADAHQYLLDHYKEYDFIWSSPPCPSHSQMRRCGVHSNSICNQNVKAIYPDMTLYQEIILLQYFSKCNWIVENVRPYYVPLITAINLERHLFWSNMNIPQINSKDSREVAHDRMDNNSVLYGFDLHNHTHKDKRKLLRNLVNPYIGKYLLDIAMVSPFKIDNLEVDFGLE